MRSNELRSVLLKLREIPSLNTLKSVSVGNVKWNTQEIVKVLLPFLSASPNLEDFIMFDSNLGTWNHPLYEPDFIG